MAQSPEDQALNEVMELLEATPDTTPPTGLASIVPVVSNIPEQWEKLAILVSTGKSKEAIGLKLTHDQVKRLSDKEVGKLYQRYETYVGNKITDSLVDNAIRPFTKGISMVFEVKDEAKFQQDLKNDFVISHELSMLAGRVALSCGQYLAVANVGFITASNIRGAKDGKGGGVVQGARQTPTHPSRDSDGYPLEGVDEVGVDLAATSQKP